MLHLKDITLVAISSNRIAQTEEAIAICLEQAIFGEVIFVSHVQTAYPTVLVEPINYYGYNRHCIKTLPSLIKTPFMLKIHWDGYIVNPKAWTDDFLQYDYIGAPWPHLGIVGNGGFSLRSKKLLDNIETIEDTDIEDVIICQDCRDCLEEHGICFAPLEVGYQFSSEYPCGSWQQHQSFGFHDYRLNNPLNKEIDTQKDY